MKRRNHAFRRFWLTGSILALLAITVGLILEMGVWQRTEVVYGPFATETPEGRMVIVPIASDLLLRPVLDVPGNSVSSGNAFGPEIVGYGRHVAPPAHRPRSAAGRHDRWLQPLEYASLTFFLPTPLPNDKTPRSS